MADISKEQQDAILFIEFLEAAYKLGRNAGLEAAQQICREINCIQNFEGAVASIESLKDNSL